MKRILLIAITALGMSATALAETYTIDSSHTFPVFEINHLGLSTFRGRFEKTTGTVMLDQVKKQGSVEATIDVKSVSTGVDKLNEHLQSPDFFDAGKYPTITFKSTGFRFDGDQVKSVAGNLTIHGVTKPVTLTATSFACKPHPKSKKPVCGADLETKIKRSDFGVSYGVPMVGDEVTLKIGVEANAEQ